MTKHSIQHVIARSVFTFFGLCLAGAAWASTPDAAPPAEAPVIEAEDAPVLSMQEREAQLRQRFAGAIEQIRVKDQFFSGHGEASEAMRARDGLLEGIIRLQRGDRMAWTPPQCAAIAEGVKQLYLVRGPNRLDKPGAQLETTTILNLASMCDELALNNLAMQSLSHVLGDMRERGTERRLSTALSIFSSNPERSGFRASNVSYLVPFFEALFTVADAASVERISEAMIAATGSAVPPQIQHYATMARNAPKAHLTVNPPEGCQPMVNGEAVSGPTIDLRIGWHSVSCKDGAFHHLYFSSVSSDLYPPMAQ